MVRFYKCPLLLEHNEYSPLNKNCTLYFSSILCLYYSIHQLRKFYLPIINITNVFSFSMQTFGLFWVYFTSKVWDRNPTFFPDPSCKVSFIGNQSFSLSIYVTFIICQIIVLLIYLWISIWFHWSVYSYNDGTFWLADNQ